MTIVSSALNLLAFPQHWDGAALTVRFLCLPQTDPTEPLSPGLPAFCNAELQFEARLIGSLDHLPRAVDSVPVGPLAMAEPPNQKAALFAELKTQIPIAPGDPPPMIAPPPPTFRKPIAASYRALVGNRQMSPWLTDEEIYECSLHAAHTAQPAEPAVLRGTLDWSEVLAFALRQPKLAMALGLVGETQIVPPDASFFARGGWLHIGLAAGGNVADAPGLVSSFAARIPPLDAARDVYTTLLFPVDDAGVADDSFPDAERYDRGFARLVHAAQGDADADGIRLAWDDEHIADAFARQVAAGTSRPMGTAGFRVDVQDNGGDGRWHSLQRIASIGELKLGELVIGDYQGEGAVEVVPVQASPANPGDFWMPPYFCAWRGASLVLTDTDLTRLHQRVAVEPGSESMRLGRQLVFAPVADKDVPLLYGHEYRFRVRLVDLSRGGPSVDADLPDDTNGEAHHAVTVDFRRHCRPGLIEVLDRPTPRDLRIRIAKPRLRHPEMLFTGKHSFDDLENALDADMAADLQREAGVPDPDVVVVSIRLEVRTLKGDSVSWQRLYETTREFEGPELTLQLAKVDLAALTELAGDQPGNGALQIPTSRDVRLVLAAIGHDQPGYFASEEARSGPEVTVELRAGASAESPLFVVPPALHSFFFRAGGNGPPVPRPLARLAQETGLDAHVLTLSGRPGMRTIFGCASTLRHILSPERSALTIASDGDLSQRWINVLQFELARDWTWDGLAADGLVVRRRISRPGAEDDVAIAGTIDLPRTLTAAILEGVAPDARDPPRAFSRVVFVDAVDPKPEPGKFPEELTVSYAIEAVLRDAIPAPPGLSVSVLLPVTTPPTQVPQLVSAGIALSPHAPADDYSATNQRQRMLWLEFDAPPDDPQDTYFVRVLACSADPLLTPEIIPEVVPEPVLAIDDESMRQITPLQPRDDNGLNAMQPLLQQSAAGASYLVPLPDRLDANAAELFGMFTYEVRLGHNGERWSTAQGRFGPPLRIAGVQHPPPALVCQSARTADAVLVRAPFATPVQDGRHVRPMPPQTRLWALLYARVEQADAAAWRNLMLLRTPLFPHFDDPLIGQLSAAAPPLLYGKGIFEIPEIERELLRRGLAANAPLTALAVEFHTGPDIDDPLGTGLGHARMLRVSPLISVPDMC